MTVPGRRAARGVRIGRLTSKCAALLPAIVLALAGVPGRAEESARAAAVPPKVWSDKSELGYVQTGGNSATSTLGFKNTLNGAWTASRFELKAAAVRAESTTITRFGTGSVADPIEHTLRDSELTAASYALSGRYDHTISKRVFWFASAGWDRNTFAGIQNRTSLAAGVGNVWRDSARTKFRTDYAVTVTRQVDVVENPAVSEDYAGLRLSSKFSRVLGPVTTIGNDFIADENLKETSDWRFDLTNWLSVAMNNRLALKVSMQSLYDHQPAFQSVTVFDVYPPSPPAVALGTALVQLDRLDTVFQTSLVVSF